MVSSQCQWTKEAITSRLPLVIKINYKCFIFNFTWLLNVETIHLHVILHFVIFRSEVIVNGKVHRCRWKSKYHEKYSVRSKQNWRIWLLRIRLYLPDSTRTRYWTFAHLVQLRMRCCWNAYLKKWKLENLMSNKMNLRKQIDGNPCRAWIGIDNNENVYFPTYRVPKVSE